MAITIPGRSPAYMHLCSEPRRAESSSLLQSRAPPLFLHQLLALVKRAGDPCSPMPAATSWTSRELVFFLLSFFFLLTSTIESRWEALKKRNSVQERINTVRFLFLLYFLCPSLVSFSLVFISSPVRCSVCTGQKRICHSIRTGELSSPPLSSTHFYC